MEFLDLDFDDCECIEAPKEKKIFDFPVVTFSENHKGQSAFAVFNKAAVVQFGDCKYMLVCSKGEYLVFAPTNSKSINSFKIYYSRNIGYRISASALRRFCVVGKQFKLYKTQKGFAIKVNEPIENDKEKS